MSDNPRIEELRRRVQKDPASIAFAQLAEEHRRAGEYDEAIRVSRAGLAVHPTYLSARVTLGRALLEIGAYDESQAELEEVLRAAPDNLAAIRTLAELHQHRRQAREGEVDAPVEAAAETIVPPLPLSAFADTALPSEPPAAEADAPVDDDPYARALETLRAAAPDDLPPPEPDTFREGDGALDAAPLPAAPAPGHQPPAQDRVVDELEAWLAAILADRERRSKAP